MAKPKQFRKIFKTVRKYVFKNNTEQKKCLLKTSSTKINNSYLHLFYYAFFFPSALSFLLEYAKLSGIVCR